MAKQAICDRCGKSCAFYSTKAWRPLKIQRKSVYYRSEYISDDGRQIEYMLCNDCIDQFKAWIKRGRDKHDAD